MLVACRLAGLSALERTMQGSNDRRDADRAIPRCGLSVHCARRTKPCRAAERIGASPTKLSSMIRSRRETLRCRPPVVSSALDYREGLRARRAAA